MQGSFLGFGIDLLSARFLHLFPKLLFAGLLLGAATFAASAQTISSQNPQGVADFLTARGQTVIVTVDEFDDPFIETSVNNIDYNILFYGCVQHAACTSFSLRAQRTSNGTSSFEAMNEWNLEQRWTKIYTADINSAILEMDFLFTSDPLPRNAFGAYLDIWDRSLAQFVRYVDDGQFDYVE